MQQWTTVCCTATDSKVFNSPWTRGVTLKTGSFLQPDDEDGYDSN